jgi:hypothetical protein
LVTLARKLLFAAVMVGFIAGCSAFGWGAGQFLVYLGNRYGTPPPFKMSDWRSGTRVRPGRRTTAQTARSLV